MDEPFIGQIMQVAFNYAPRGWAVCDGTLLRIPQYQALAALLGTTFGGDGVLTFGLPNATGRALIGTGDGYQHGAKGGVESVLLTQAHLPPHTHNATFTGRPGAMTGTGTLTAKANVTPQDNQPTEGASLTGGNSSGSLQVRIYAPAGSTGTDVNLAGVKINAGSSTPSGTVTVEATANNSKVSIMQPFLALTTIIALTGLYPTRP